MQSNYYIYHLLLRFIVFPFRVKGWNLLNSPLRLSRIIGPAERRLAKAPHSGSPVDSRTPISRYLLYTMLAAALIVLQRQIRPSREKWWVEITFCRWRATYSRHSGTNRNHSQDSPDAFEKLEPRENFATYPSIFLFSESQFSYFFRLRTSSLIFFSAKYWYVKIREVGKQCMLYTREICDFEVLFREPTIKSLPNRIFIRRSQEIPKELAHSFQDADRVIKG